MSISVDRFVQALSKTGIVTPAEAEALVHSLPPDKRAGDADELARELVRQGKLTRFQAAAIYQNKAEGLVLGNYLILDKLGAGGMGQVFRARHQRMDRVVAIKVLSKKLLDSPDAVARFQREAKAAARLTHPNIVTAHDADEANGLHFLVMEYVDGSDLAAIVKQQGALPANQALDFLLQAARGLEHAHGEGVVHRDIKPSNLLLDKKGTLKILDMGLARMSDPLADPSAAPGADLTQSGSIMGTIDYMAPEQAMDSRQADARADIYSLGCTLHYLLTGRPPYGGDTVLKRLTAHQQAAIPLLSTTRPDVPPGFDEVFGRMLAKRPAARFQTSKELVAALDALRNQPASSRPVPVVAQAIAVQPVAPVPATPVPSGLQSLESIMLPGIERGSGKPRKSSSKMPLVAAAVALLLTVAGAGAWMMAGHKPEEVAQNDPQPAATPDSTPAPEPVAEPRPSTPAVTVTPEAMPAHIEPPVDAAVTAPPLAPPVAAPVVAAAPAINAAPSSPSVASPPDAVASSPMPVEQPEPADAKLPVPSADSRRDAIKLVKELYQDDYAQAKQPDAKAALAEKLLNGSEQARDDLNALYTMLIEARDLAVEAANPALAERAIGMLAGRFAIEPMHELTAAFEEMTGKPHPAETNRSIAEAALARVEEAQGSGDFDIAKRLTDVALAAARKSKDASLSKRAIETGKAVTAAKQQADAWQKAQATLSQTPDDPAANLAVGRYLCFVQGDWDQGLPHLAKGPDGPLKDLAAKSQQPPPDAAALADLGDAWLNAAEKAKGKDKPDLRAGAAYWYSQAEPELTGLAKTVVEKRLSELGGKVAVRSARSEIPLANGVWLPQTFDCGLHAYPVTLGPNFNLQRSWTLALEFRPTNFDGGSHQLFFWGDGRASHDPICLRLSRTTLETRLCEATKSQDDSFGLGRQLPDNAVGVWHQAAVHFDANNREVSLYLDGAVFAQGKSPIVPAVDRPMKLFLGGEHETGQRYYGQVRNVWLGNQDRLVVPDMKAAAPVAIGKRGRSSLPKSSSFTASSAGKIPETVELLLAPGVAIKFRFIPAGKFVMGSPPTEAGRANTEIQHEVTLSKPFYLGVTELTQAQWLAVMGNNPSATQGDLARPVEKVNPGDVQRFLATLNQSPLASAYVFRLPTEAEWEYACRAGTTTVYSFGDDPGRLKDYAWFADNSSGTTHPVGQLKPNPWGLYDMHGNVWEWCSDWTGGDNYYLKSAPVDPPGPETGTSHVNRGGSEAMPVSRVRSATHGGDVTRHGTYGFRLACEPVRGFGRTPASTAPRAMVSRPTAPRTTAVINRPMAFNQADVERNVAKWVLSLGGKVKVTLPVSRDPNPREIADAAQLPAEPFVVFGIDLSRNKTVTDKDLARLDGLMNLVELRLMDTSIGDQGMSHIGRMTNLNLLWLHNTKVTDAGLAALDNLKDLKYLFLSGTKTTDAGFAHLRRLTEIRSLALHYTGLTDAGIKNLAAMRNLRWLAISYTKTTDVALHELTANPGISTLEMLGTKISDAGLMQLRSMPLIADLNLSNTAISDAGLQVLATLPRLSKLRVAQTKITDAAIQQFKAARPNCDIAR